LSGTGPLWRFVHLYGQRDGGRAPATVPDQLRRRAARHAFTGYSAQVPQGTGGGYRGYRPRTSHGHGYRSHTPGKIYLSNAYLPLLFILMILAYELFSTIQTKTLSTILQLL